MNYRIYKSSSMERLCLTSSNIELWWDSSPLAYEEWHKNFIDSMPEDLKDVISFQLTKLWNKKLDPEDWVLSGAITDPLFTKTAFYKFNDLWEGVIQNIIQRNSGMDYKQVAWEVYKDICKRGAECYMPLFESSGYKNGFTSVQVDPRLLTNAEGLVKQGLELKALQPNIMVQVPATKAGIHAIYILTSLGVPTNATLCFTLPQILAVAEAVEKGKKIGEKCAIDYSRWRSIITMMIGRFDDSETLTEQASERGIELNEETKRWAGIAVTKKACRILKEGNFSSKILIASGKMSPRINGIQYIWHIEKLAGCNLIFSINPELMKSFILLYMDRIIENLENEPIPEEVIEKLLKIPFFAESYGEDTIRQEDFEVIEPMVTTNNQLINAVIDFENYIKAIF